MADVSVTAFEESTYTTAITVPGLGGTSYNYSIPLDKPILVYGGTSDDNIEIVGDLGVDIIVDGMLGTDNLSIDAGGAAVGNYVPNGFAMGGVDQTNFFGNSQVTDFGGQLSYGSTQITFGNFELSSEVVIDDVGTFRVSGGNGVDSLRVDRSGAATRVQGTTNGGTGVVPVLATNTIVLDVETMGGDDTLTVDYVNGNPMPAGGITYDGGGQTNGDTLIVNDGTFTTIRSGYTNANDGSVNLDGDVITYTGLEPVLLNVGTVANAIFNLPAGVNPDVLLGDDTATNFPGNGLATANTSAIDGSTFEYTSFTNPTTSLTVNGNTSADTISMINLDAGWTAPTINLNGDSSADEIRVAATPAGTTTNVDTESGVPLDLLIVGAIVGSGGNTATAFAQFNTGVSTLDFILGDINVDDAGTVGELYVDDSGDTDADVVTFTNAEIIGAAPATIGYDTNGDVNIIQLALGTGSDTIDVQGTGADEFSGGRTTIFGNSGEEVFTIDGDGLSGRNTFQGNQGNDSFELNITTELGSAAASYSPLSNLMIEGNAPGLDSENRDRLTINDDSAAARSFTYDYLGSAGDLDLRDGFSIPVGVRTMETLVFNSLGPDNDLVTIEGTSADDDLTVALRDSDRAALVFLGGSPYVSLPPESIGGSLPGVAGGGTGPDLSIHGIGPAGIELDGTGNTGTVGQGNRAIVYAASEMDLMTGGTLDYFGFGPGVLVPGFGAGDAFDDIETNTAIADGVRVTNNANGPLVDVRLAAASFVQVGPATSSQRAALIVNGGDEAMAQPNGVADDFTALPSPDFHIQLNGNLPGLAFGPNGLPVGDRLTLASPGSLNVFSDKATPPLVTTTFGADVFGIRDSSIEQVVLTPGNGKLNLVGDNNEPAVDQNDNFVVVGRNIDFPGDADGGTGEGTLEINGSTPRLFNDVTHLNAFGDDQNPPPGTPSAGNDIDTFEITPYADDTPRGWGIDVFFDEGNPTGVDGAQTDLIIYNTALVGGMVSEHIEVKPSGPDNGEIVVTNSSDGSLIVDIDYVGNTDIVINDNDGFLNDTDTVTLHGTDGTTPQTSGNENVLVDFDTTNPLIVPAVRVFDADTSAILYQVRTITGIETVNFDLGDGNDDLRFVGPASNVTPGFDTVPVRHINYRGGSGDDRLLLGFLASEQSGVSIDFDGGSGRDSIDASGTPTVPASLLEYTIGHDEGSGQIVASTGAAPPLLIDFENLEPITWTANTANLVINANDADNAISYSQGPTATLGRVAIDGFELMNFANATALTINALGGSDEISLNNSIVPTGLASITVNGGAPSAGSDSVEIIGTPADDTFAYTPTAANGGIVTQGGAIAMAYLLSDVESLAMDGVGQAASDAMTVTTTNATITPGSDPGTGVVDPVSAIGEPLLSATYAGMEAATVTGTTAVIQGTAEDDTIDVSAAGIVTVTNELGFANTVDVSAFTAIVINALGGDDAITVAPSALAVTVIGGDNGTGSDTLDFAGTGGAVTLDLTAKTLTEAGLGAVAYTGIEHVNVDTAGGAFAVTGTADNDIFSVTPLGAGNDGRFTHNLSPGIAFTYDGATTVNFADVAGGGGTDTIELHGDEVVDTVTATASTITIDGSTVTLGAGLEALKLHTLGGDDDINLTGFTNGGAAMNVEIHAGIGNDTVRGSDLDDVIYGGAGNDILMGGLGSDTQHGEDGRDIFGNPGLAPNGVADDPGTDYNFGGAGDDNFIWEPGDGTDFNQGGNDGADVFRFFGSAGANAFRLVPGGTPTHFNAFIGGTLIDNHGVEDVIVQGRGGTDSYLVGDLFTTEVINVRIDLDGADAEAVRIEGRHTADTLQVTPDGTRLSVQGLSYDVALDDATTADRLTIASNAGGDTIHVNQGVETLITTELFAGAGDDTLSGWFNRASGEDGNDAFVGAPIDQSMDGGDGDDSFIGNGGTDAVGAGAGMIGDAIHVPGTPGDDAIDISLNPAGHLVVTVNGDTTVYTDFVGGSIDTSGIDRIVVEGGLGDDTLTVDSVNGAIPIAIHYDGDQDFDALTLLGGMATSSTYSPGPNPGQGLSEITIGGVTQTVSFTGLEPVIDLVGGPLVVNANPADNAITYDQSPNNAAWGRVTIDRLESIEFANKTTLTINAGAGDDAISLNNPATPTGLTGITVNGGDPTSGSDRVIVSGTTGPDVIDFAPSSDNDAIITGAGPVAITLDTIESALIDGQGDGDILTYTSPAGGDNLVYQPAATPDAGTIRGHSQAGVPFVSFMPLAFAGLDADGLVTILDAGGGRNDSVEIRGTSDNDVFDLAASGVLVITDSDANRHTVPIDLSASGAVLLHGLSGDDLFNIPGDHLFPGVFGGPGILVEGGNPGSGSDVLNFTGAGATVTVDLGLQTVAEAGFGAVAYSGIETLNADAGGVGLNVVATGEDDDVTVTVLDANSGRLEHGYTMNRLGQPLADPAAPLVRYTNTGASAINVDLAGGEDTLNVVGNALAQTFDVDVTTGTVAIDDAPLAGNDGTVTYVNNESLGVFGLEGDDTFDVTPGQIPVFIDGGDPVGSSAGDTINVDAGGAAVTLESGPENDEGGILVAGSARISYDHIEALAAVAAMKALILGTNADDDITVIARDASTYALADGVQDFTVSVNAGPMVLFLDTPELYVDAAAGDDDIVLRTPAPNDASWDVDVYVAGGAPSDGEPGDGDRLVLETPGTDTILYTPTGSDTGTLLIDDNNDGLDDGVNGGADSLITIGPFNVVCPGLDYTSDPGGVERLEYDGEAAGDSFSIVAPAGDDTITHTPGNGFDEGSLRVNTTLAVHYQNLGSGAALTVSDTGGTDNLVAHGTASDDVFDVAATSGAISLVTPSTTFLALTQTGVENLKLDGLDGNDRFNINAPQPYAGVDVFGGGPGGSDVLTVVGAAGTDEEFTVTPAFDRGDGQVDVAGGGALAIPYVGIEHVLLQANGGDTDNLTVNEDASDNQWTVDAGPIFGDRIQIDDRESIDFVGFNDVTLDNGFGSDVFSIHPTNLVGLDNELIVRSAGNSQDVLCVVGTEADDSFTSDTDTITLDGIDVTAGDTGFAEVRVESLGGNDSITLALDLAGVRKVIDAGAGDDNVDASAMQDATIFGGLGDDILVGSPLADLIFGGSGNDTISGLGGDDTIDGGDGNDTITGGTGSDRVFGGADADRLIWNQGDGSDLNEGGTGNDVVVFNGATAAEVAVEDFTLSAQTPALDSVRILLDRTQGGVQLDIGSVEQIDIVGGTGVENVQVNELTHTDLQILNVDNGPDGDTESIRVEGRGIADDLAVIGQPGGLILGNQPDVVFVIDVSGSTSSGFAGTPVGDLNGDGTSDTILDAEIAGFIRLNQELIARGLGTVADVSIVAFNSTGTAIDLDPVAPGVQTSTTPSADADADGVLDVEQALSGLVSGGGTDFENALDAAISTFTTLGTTPGNGNMIFLSDGDGGGGTADEVATLSGMGVNIKAYGVGTGSSLPNLQIIDPAAFQFTTTDELITALGGGAGGVGAVALSGPIKVTGLQYDVNILRSNTTDADSLTVDGNQGDDLIEVEDGVEAVIVTTLEGGLGDDHLSGAFNTADGGDGDDFLRGSTGDQLFFGGTGEDTMVGGPGADTFDGGMGFDTILVEGFASDDRIDVRQDDATTLRHEVGNTINGFDGVLGGGGTETDTLVINTVEQVRIVAGEGDDTIRVAHDDALVAAGVAADMLRITVEGGAPGASDRLTVVDDGDGDTTVQRLGQTDGEGSFTMYAYQGGNPANPIIPLPPVVYSDVEYASLHPVLPVTGGTGDDGNGRLFVFKYDPFEQNQSLPTATFLGADSALNLDPNIDPGVDAEFGTPGDEDWYRVVAERTGTLDFQVYFHQQGALANGRAGLPGAGDLDIAVFDADGLVNGVPLAIAGSGAFGTNDTDDDERVRIPAVAGQTYYLRVVGAGLPAGDNLNASGAINAYNVSVVNDAPATPFDLELADNLTILTGDQEVPAVATNANGTANFQYDAAANTFDLDLFVAGLELADTTDDPELLFAHIHRGAVGANGPVIVTLSAGVGGWVQEPSGIRLRLDDAPFSGAAADIAALLAGDTYINVHSTANPGGEVRGQIAIQNVLGVSDSGRSQFDNVTQDNTPTILLRLDDALLLNDLPGNAAGTPGAAPPDEVISIPHIASTAASPVGLPAGYRVAIYDETDTHNPVLLGFAQPIAGLNGVYSFTFTTPLAEGSHFISSRVQMIDPADNDADNGTTTPATGFGPRSVSMEIIVDTATPPVSFGDAAVAGDGLHPDSDSGDAALPATLVDRITNDTTPTFFGRAEANSIVRLYVDIDGNSVISPPDVLIGQTVAVPTDGTNQSPNGEWQITSTVNMNDPNRLGVLGVDGDRKILVQAEDQAGNLSGNGLAFELDIFIDTRGPQVTDVFITDRPDFDIFTLKPDSPEPTPRVDSLTINVQDLPDRVAAFLYPAISNLAVVPNVLPLGLVTLVGDHSGVIAATSVTFTSDGDLNAPGVQPLVPGNPATGFITMQFAQPLPDDRFTLTLLDSIIDPAGNALDGESNAAEPVGTPLFPSGDGLAGGDFVARFTVDSRPEVGVWSQELVYVDINGNMVWDPEGEDNDATNRDFIYHFGTTTDAYFAGNFAAAGAATASGFDKMGTFGRFNGQYEFFIDTDDDGIGDTVGAMFFQVNVLPVAGDFDPAHPGDEIGGFDGQNWYLDVNGDNMIDGTERFATELRGIPVVGDFNGDGNDDLATFNNDTGQFQFDLDRDGTVDDTLSFFFSGFGEKPVAGDVNLDGIDDIVLWVPNRDGQLPQQSGEFHFLASDNPPAFGALPVMPPAVNALPSDVFDDYSPAPLGNDLISQFGDEFALPILGNFDPPVGDVTPLDTTGWFTNLDNPLDVDGSGDVTPYDALLVVNALNRGITSAQPSQALRVQQAFDGHFLDVDGNRRIDPTDVLQIINDLNRRSRGGQGEGGQAEAAVGTAASYAAAVDAVFADDEDEDELLLDWADNDALRSTL
ncbi:CHRD domain-containing protein [Roseimaritima sediminicola]|uniref:CHRD domain-containing protein n=1 Tax=Roseimaritima sediminicola TaxID=2662066 RepID=UPI001F16460C|nr:CHRD domain-containing protein [Roseimaritima sediminicola]